MSLVIKARKPRNPLVAAAAFRRAGAHVPTGGARRQAEGRALKQELGRLDLRRDRRAHPPSP